MIKNLVDLEIKRFDAVHFKQRLIDLKHYVFLKKEGDAYNTGYFDALEQVLKMMEDN